MVRRWFTAKEVVRMTNTRKENEPVVRSVLSKIPCKAKKHR